MTNTTIHNRFDPAKSFESIAFRQDKVLQSAELNEMQAMQAHRLRGITDALFKDGDVVRGARITVNADTGAVKAEAGAIYLHGAVRGVPPGAFTVPTVGIVNVGIYLRSRTVTELDDPSLLNPATGTPAYQEAGAWRTQLTPTWGYAGDGQAGGFFAVWEVEDGYVRSKEPPPNLDAVTQALARYDRDSAGGSYIVEGLTVARAPDMATGEQVYTIAEGRARVTGYGMEQRSSRRVVYATAADIKLIDSEPHLSATEAAQRVNLDRAPAFGVPQVRITARKTVDVVHGGFEGAADPLPDASVVELESVKQGATHFPIGVVCKLTAGQVDWSAAGPEPAPGSTYQATYKYVSNANPTDVDHGGFTVAGALAGTIILVTYQQQLKRIDRLCMDAGGTPKWVKGISAEWAAAPPTVPPGLLLLASVYQSWDGHSRVVQDGVRVVQMPEIASYASRIDRIMEDQAELRLAVDVSGRHAGVRKGLFADPFISDAMRDAGVAQTGAIVGGALRLPLAVAVHEVGQAITMIQSVAHGYKVVVQQSLRTGAMPINPYQSFRVLPASVVLTPDVDRWTDITTQWASAITNRLYSGYGSLTSYAGSSTSVQLIGETSTNIEHLRQIDVRFDLAGFAPAEQLASVTFDGIGVAPQALPGGTLIADAQGKLSGRFRVPASVPAGTKEVTFAGTGGSTGVQFFTGQGTAILQKKQNVTTEQWNRYDAPVSSGGGYVVGPGSNNGNSKPQESACSSRWAFVLGLDPLAQTFSLDAAGQIAGVDVRFTKAAGDVIVQVRETLVGIPSSEVLVQQTVRAQDMVANGYTRITWPPILLAAGREYALVLICNDPDTAVSIAELGAADIDSARWVTSQPYQVGVLLSSSNASTWTPHQDRDLTFRLLAADYTSAERVIDLGSANVVGATDLMVMGYADSPAPGASMVFELEFPGTGGQTVRVADGQVIWLGAPYTGAVQVRARLRTNAGMAAVLHPGVQLIAGALQAAGNYITPMVTAGANSRVRVIFDAEIPPGSAVHVHCQGSAEGAAWVEVPYLTSSAATAGVREIQHELDGFTADRLRVRLSLSGNTAARPSVRNLRIVVL